MGGSAGSYAPGFPTDQGALARETPVVAAEVAVAPQYAMTRYDERNGIAADRRPHCARGC